MSELSAAYVFLRNLEHRLMYVEDQQTQDLPNNMEAQTRIASSMRFADWASFSAQLEQYRKSVQQHFDAVFQEEKISPEANASVTSAQQSSFLSTKQSSKDVWLGLVADDEANKFLLAIGYSESSETLRRLHSLHASAKYQQLPTLSRQRFDALMPSVIALAANETKPDVTLLRMSDLLESICRRASYLALLAEYPTAHQLGNQV